MSVKLTTVEHQLSMLKITLKIMYLYIDI